METRELGPADWETFRDLRLLALKTEPGKFSSTYEREAAFTDETWRERMRGDSRAMFGLFDGERMVGITGVIPNFDDPADGTAFYVATFLLPEYRGRGLSAMFYDARIAFVRANSKFTRVVVGHRASNEASGRAMRRAGFREISRTPRTWPDGITEDEIRYELWV